MLWLSIAGRWVHQLQYRIIMTMIQLPHITDTIAPLLVAIMGIMEPI
jgi:hypothetical protein